MKVFILDIKIKNYEHNLKKKVNDYKKIRSYPLLVRTPSTPILHRINRSGTAA